MVTGRGPVTPVGYNASALDDRAPQRLAAYAGIVGIVTAAPVAWLDPGGLDARQLAILLGISAVVAAAGVAFCRLAVNARDPGRRVSAATLGLMPPFGLVAIAVLERPGWGVASVILGPAVGPAVVTFLAARHRLLGRDRWRLLGGVALSAIGGWLGAAVGVTLWTVSQSSGPESPDSGAISRLPPGFRSVQGSERFVVWTDLQSVPDLLSEAERALRHTCGMLEVSFDSYPMVPIVVFSSRDDALAYDTALGLRFRTSVRHERPWIRAWFHRRQRVIVMVGVKKRPRDVVRHEVVHSVIDWQVPRCPPALDEGLAMYVSELLLPRSEESNPFWIRRRSNRATVLGRAKALPLQELLEMSGDRFRAPRDNRNHYLSWCLVLELVEHPGLVARLFRALRSSSVSSRGVFRATLPNDLEARWKARVRSEAAHGR